ncbi:hypothetical protein ACFL2V_17795 [Pseudomonadota bacterium]
MNSGKQYSENQVLMEALKKALNGREEDLMQLYIQEGPQALKEKLNIRGEGDFRAFFDYLVLRTDALKNCALQYMPFFKNLVEEKGPGAIRETFGIEGEQYDDAFKKIFELVCICEGALYDYIYKNKNALTKRVLEGKGSEIRKELCLEDKDYSRLWMEILEILQDAVCDKVMEESQIEHGLDAFSTLMNTFREQRSLRSYKKMWEYLEANN